MREPVDAGEREEVAVMKDMCEANLTVRRQTSLKEKVVCRGKTLHSGALSCVTVHPRLSGGIVFCRNAGGVSCAQTAACWRNVVESELCTTLRSDDGHTIATIEHLMAALAACGVDHALVEVSGDELPAMDGSAAPYVEMIEAAGVVELAEPRRVIRILEPLVVRDADRYIQARPAGRLTISCQIEFHYIAQQSYRFDGDFGDITPARTFCYAGDVEAMRKRGRALGGSLSNALVLNENGAINPEGMRFGDECARHKVLDMVGDLLLAGAPLQADITAFRPGHALTLKFLRALMAKPAAWRYEDDIVVSPSSAPMMAAI